MKSQTSSRIVIVGAGTTGIMLANKLTKFGHQVTVVDPTTDHYYQPGFLFVPFGRYKISQIRRPLAKLLRKRVTRKIAKVAGVQAVTNQLTLDNGETVSYDVLVIASGTHIDPSLTPGLTDVDWRKEVFDYYSPEGAEALQKALANFQGGDLVVQIMEMPIKCPVAPLEFTFLADDYFKKRSLRDKVNLSYVTPLPGAFTKPVASAKLGHMLADRNIAVVTDFLVEKVDPITNKIICYDGREVHYDLLITIPMNVGADFLRGSELANDMGFVEVNHRSLQSMKYSNIFAIGDAANLPTSKAGSVGHFEAHTLEHNIDNYLAGRPLEESFDGHSNCFVECGEGKALLLDFNYDTEPLEGVFPFAGIGPMKLLSPSHINHWGKLAFRFIYWHLLLPGRKIPFIPDQMKRAGKKLPRQEPAPPSEQPSGNIDQQPNTTNTASKEGGNE